MSPETYALLRQVHRTCAVLSISGFALRWLASLAGQAWVQRRPAKTLPHVIDTTLLASAIAMAVAAGFTLANAAWMTTKIVLLLAYIGLGMVALSPRRPRARRIGAGVAALLVVGHIVGVALTKHPLAWIAR